MNGEEESHWLSGTSQEPMGMKGMEWGRGATKKKKKRLWLDYYCVCYVKVKRGPVNLWELFGSFFFF